FGDDHAYALRWFAPGEPTNNEVFLSMTADGMSGAFADADDMERLAWGIENCPIVPERRR
ncbi:MAG: hypothetical protein NW200_00005, partial [Hyphomonadaceae bacterium]|nr:hypothetical protein [Hyphomonadaceae bacterium]